MNETEFSTAVVDYVRFASNLNPVTEIQLRLGRGGNLRANNWEDDNIEENTNLPIIVGGANASGKTSLLHGIQKICNLLQNSRIDNESSERVWKELSEFGIGYLELQFASVIGNSIYAKNLPSHGRNFEFSNLPVQLDPQGIEFEQPEKDVVLENLIQFKFKNDSDKESLYWRDGLRLRSVGNSEGFTKFYPNFAQLSEENKKQPFRKMKSISSIKRFLDEATNLDFDDFKLISYIIHENVFQKHRMLNFQNAEMVTVDRNESQHQIKKIRSVLPEIVSKVKHWRKNPESLRDLLMMRMKGNQLFTDLDLRTSDILYDDVNAPNFLILHDYAPGIVEYLMLNSSQNVNSYTWYGDYAFKTKQEGINFVMEGCVHDIVEFVTGHPNLQRVITGNETGIKARHGPCKYVQWSDAKSSKKSEIVWEPKPTSALDSKYVHKDLSEIIRVLPSKIISDEDPKVADILIRFNEFTPIKKFEDSYLSSGQKQVLALITAVRNSLPGSLILIDEPEISLHVDWQERLIEQLHAPLTGSRLFIATHSPDIAMNHRHLCTTLLTRMGGDFYRK